MTSIDDRKGIKIIRISGDFNMETTPDLQKLCNEATFDSSTRAVLIDFEKVEHVDSAPFACMINFMKEHMSKDLSIGIINIQKENRDLLEILKLVKVIKIYNSEQEAIDVLSV